MAARFLLDTNICIYIRQKKPAEVLSRFRRLQSGDAVISVITQGELWYGAERSQYRERALGSLRELAEFVPVLPLPEEAATAYGEIRAGLEKRGQSIGNNDLWIAAHALVADLILVTNNEREFRRVHGLKIQNWAVRLKTGRE
jgi:tRNA(fMet)-specific endonuclease VapC